MIDVLLCGATHPRHPDKPCTLPAGHADDRHDHSRPGTRLCWTRVDAEMCRASTSGDALAIERRTAGGGILRLADFPARLTCATCGRDDEPPIGLDYTAGHGAAEGAELHTAICATCVSEALAILFGRRYVQGGGDVGDLTPVRDCGCADACYLPPPVRNLERLRCRQLPGHDVP